MQNLEDLKEKIFFEAKNIIDTISRTNSPEELLLKRDLIEDLNERVSFLKLLEKNQDYFVAEPPLQIIDNENINSYSESEELHSENPHGDFEEEVLFTNELNEIHAEDEEEKEPVSDFEEEKKAEIPAENSEPEIRFETEEPKSEEAISEPEPEETGEEIPLIVNETPADDFQKAIEEKERAFAELEENRRKIVEIEKKESEKPAISSEKLMSIQEEHKENAKKFKLAHIKGLKAVESLFDEDPLENIYDEHVHESPENEAKETSSLLKANVPTDFMEAPKPKPEFRLDLNDKIAFSKTLFGGSQTDLNDAIRNLNSFKTLEEAKEYLSDLYYEKHWDKADEYAQRLWSLVENKFL
ncbi:MAG: hypothetical protein QM564_05525 [Bergeyella sp.]